MFFYTCHEDEDEDEAIIDNKRKQKMKGKNVTKTKKYCGGFTISFIDNKSEDFQLIISNESIESYLKYCQHCIDDNNQKFLYDSDQSFTPVEYTNDIEFNIRTSLAKDGHLYNRIKQIISYGIKKKQYRSDYLRNICKEIFKCLKVYIVNKYYVLSNEIISKKIKNYTDKNKSLDVLIMENNIAGNCNLNKSLEEHNNIEFKKPPQGTCFTFNESNKYEDIGDQQDPDITKQLLSSGNNNNCESLLSLL